MPKRGFIVIGLVMLLCIPLSYAALECTVRQTSCEGGEVKILGLSDVTNAHAELASQTDYDYHVCCKDTDDASTISSACGESVLGLSTPTDAHVEQTGATDYASLACLSATDARIECTYSETDCPPSQTCVVAMEAAIPSEPTTNMHVMACDEAGFTKKLCCNLNMTPVVSNFSVASGTTDFGAVPNLSVVQNLTLATEQTEVQWLEPVDARGEDYDANVRISPKLISVNSSSLDPSINNSARVTFKNLNCGNFKLYYAPGFYENEAQLRASPQALLVATSANLNKNCTDPAICKNVSCVNGELRFAAMHFSGYGLSGKTANLTINDSTDAGALAAGFRVNFSAYYVNATSGAAIGPSDGGACNITIDSLGITNELMNFVGGKWNYTIAVPTTTTWRVNCSATYYDDQYAEDSVVMLPAEFLVPEFSTYALLLAVIITIAGLHYRKRMN